MLADMNKEQIILGNLQPRHFNSILNCTTPKDLTYRTSFNQRDGDPWNIRYSSISHWFN